MKPCLNSQLRGSDDHLTYIYTEQPVQTFSFHHKSLNEDLIKERFISCTGDRLSHVYIVLQSEINIDPHNC